MALCPSCLESLPFSSCLEKVFLSRRNPRVRVYVCQACHRESELNLGMSFLSIPMVVMMALAMFLSVVSMESRQPIRHHSMGVFMVMVWLVLTFFLAYYIWWRLFAKLRPKEERAKHS